MRVTGQEGLGGSPQETAAIKATGGGAASAGGAFFALLALLQNGGAAGEVAATPDATGTIDAEDGERADAGADDATAGSAGEGVVVTLSVAANASALATVAGATTATQPQGSPAGGAAIATLVAGAGEGTQAGSGGKAVAALAARLAQGSGSAAQIATDAAAQAATSGAAGTGAAVSGDTATGAAATVATATQPGQSAEGAFARTAHGALAQPGHAGAGHAADGARTDAEHAAQGSANAAQSAPAAPATTSPGTTAQALASATAAGEGAAGTEQAIAPESARGGARRAAAAARFAAHAAEGEPESTSDAADDDTGFGPPRGTTVGGATRELPTGVRVLSDPLQLRAGLEHGAQQNTDARPEALVAARAEASTATNASNGTTRLRAAGFTNGEASLPSWVERLASPEGLAATRRGNTLHIDLEPNGLGRIELRLSFGRDGVRASVLTEHEQTRTLLASQQPQLAAALEKNELRLESFLVDVGAQSGGDGREAWRDATDPAAFDQIGLVHTTSAEPVVDESATQGRGLVNVRA